MAKALNIKTQSLKNLEVKSKPASEDTAIVVDIPVEMINEVEQDFVIHDDTVSIIAESIKRDGQLDPCIVTINKDGKTYDLLSGRHRRRAVIEAGLKSVKCIIKNNLTETEKELIILNTNLNRNNDYLPSELAFAYKRKFELLKATSDGPAMEIIAEENKISRKKVQRYISLTKLIKPLLNRVDSGNIPLIAGVQLSKLSDIAQAKVFEYLINHTDCKVTTSNVVDIRAYYNNLDLVFYPDNSEDSAETIPKNDAVEVKETVGEDDTPVNKHSSSVKVVKDEKPSEKKTQAKPTVTLSSPSDDSSQVDNLSTSNEIDTNSPIIKSVSVSSNSLLITIRGIEFFCIYGSHANGYYLAIPNFGVALELTDDVNYNHQQILSANFNNLTFDEVVDFEKFIAYQLAEIITNRL